MLRRVHLRLPALLARFTRHQSTRVPPLISTIQHDALPQTSPLSAKLNALRGQISVPDLVALRQSYESSSIARPMSCFSGLEPGVLEQVMSEVRSQLSLPVAQSLVVSELLRMCRTNDVQAFKRTVMILDGEHIGPLAVKFAAKLGPDDNSKNLMYRILAEMCAYWNNALLASTVVLGGPDIVKMDVVQCVVRTLLVKDPSKEEIYLDLLIKVGLKYNYNFNESEVSLIFEKLAQLQEPDTMFNRVSEYLMNHSTLTTREKQIGQVYDLILTNARLRNNAGVYLHWRSIMNQFPKLTDHDPRIISTVILSMLREKQHRIIADELIAQLPEESRGNPLLTNAYLEYSLVKDRIDIANDVISRLHSPIPSSVLTQLLRINMKLDDYTGMESVMEQINTQGGMTALDYATIVEGMLKGRKLLDAVKLTQGIPEKLCGSACLKIINHLVDKRHNWEEREFAIVQSLTEKMCKSYPLKSKRGQGVWSVLGGLYVKYLTRFKKKGLWDARGIYERSTKDYVIMAHDGSVSKNKVLDTEIATNPFIVPEWQRLSVRLAFDAKGRIIAVKTILDAALKMKDKKLVDWALLELVELGLSPKEIKVEMARKQKGKLRKVGLREWEAPHKFEEFWEEKSLKFVDEKLKQLPEDKEL